MASPTSPAAKIIDGKAIAQEIRDEIAKEVRSLSQSHNKVPGLAVVIVGSRKDSQTYVSTKRKACAEVGIRSFDVDLAEDVSESDVIARVHELNADPDVHGGAIGGLQGLFLLEMAISKHFPGLPNKKLIELWLSSS